MFWRFLWMLNDWSWGFRIAQMHLDWIRFACLRSFNFFGGENIFATFCMHLRNNVLSDFIQAGSQYHLDCKYLSFKIICLPRSLSLNYECNLLKALLDDCNVSRVKLFPTSFVGQTHQEQRFPVILREYMIRMRRARSINQSYFYSINHMWFSKE